MSNNTNSRISAKSREERIKLMLQREQEGHACPNCMPCTCNICMRCEGCQTGDAIGGWTDYCRSGHECDKNEVSKLNRDDEYEHG